MGRPWYFVRPNDDGTFDAIKCDGPLPTDALYYAAAIMADGVSETELVEKLKSGEISPHWVRGSR